MDADWDEVSTNFSPSECQVLRHQLAIRWRTHPLVMSHRPGKLNRKCYCCYYYYYYYYYYY